MYQRNKMNDKIEESEKSRNNLLKNLELVRGI